MCDNDMNDSNGEGTCKRGENNFQDFSSCHTVKEDCILGVLLKKEKRKKHEGIIFFFFLFRASAVSVLLGKTRYFK